MSSTWTQDRNCFVTRFRVDPARRAEFEGHVQDLLVFAKSYYDRGAAFAFQGWARDPNEWVAIASWDEDVVTELRATDDFQRLNGAMMDCCDGPVVLENFAGMKKDREIFDKYPAGDSQIHQPGKVQHMIFR